MTNWSFFGILIDPVRGQSYNLAAVENSADTIFNGQQTAIAASGEMIRALRQSGGRFAARQKELPHCVSQE